MEDSEAPKSRASTVKIDLTDARSIAATNSKVHWISGDFNLRIDNKIIFIIIHDSSVIRNLKIGLGFQKFKRGKNGKIVIPSVTILRPPAVPLRRIT